MIDICQEYGEVADIEAAPDAVDPSHDDLTDGWRVWWRTDPDEHGSGYEFIEPVVVEVVRSLTDRK